MPLIFICVLLGLCVGSLIGVIVDRFETSRSWAIGRSVCDACQMKLGVIDLIPVMSFVVLRGACRGCRTCLSWRYPIIELIIAVLFAIVAWRLTVPWLQPVGFIPASFWIFLIRDLLFTSILSILFLIDARHGVLPDSWTLPAILFMFLFNLWLGIPRVVLALGALVCGGFFAVQFFGSRGVWVGDGDIRLGVLIGVMFGVAQGVFALGIAYVMGAIYGIWSLARGKAQLKSILPFGPFLAVAAWIVLIFGTWILNHFVRF